MHTYVGWKELLNTGTLVPYQQGKLVKFKVTPDKAKKERPSEKYVWAKGHSCNTECKKCRGRLQRELESSAGHKSRTVEMYRKRRAAGPYCRDDDQYLDTWWEWVSSSTPFFWNWQKQYQEEVRDGQPHFPPGDFGKSVCRQDPPPHRKIGNYS